MDLQCPYCPETCPSPSRLVTHLTAMHRNAPVDAVNKARTVETVEVTGNALTAETRTVRVVQCVCGAPIEPLDGDTEYPMWTHVFPAQAALRAESKCTDAIPAAGMPTKQDRANLDTALARTGAGLAEAGREMAEMRAALDAVDARMAKLDAQLTSPATVRRATLNQVWDRLLDAGDLTGAAIVMKMINAVVDDS